MRIILQGTTPLLIGVALGAYGLTQGLLQIPFGLLSDRVGRKPVISAGLAFFGIGSIVAALSHRSTASSWGAFCKALAPSDRSFSLLSPISRGRSADAGDGHRRNHHRSFLVLAIVIGPLLGSVIGVPGIFRVTFGLALVGIAITIWLVPTPKRVVRHRDAEAVPALFARVLRTGTATARFRNLRVARDFDGELSRRPASSCILAASCRPQRLDGLSADFVRLRRLHGARHHRRGKGRPNERNVHRLDRIAGSQLVALALGGGIGAVLILALVGFFTAFNIMEAMLPSLVTKSAPADAKGTATGIYSSLQFLGIFVGGVGGGWANSVAGAKGVFAFTVVVAVVWLILAATMSRPRKYSNYLVHLTSADWAGSRRSRRN